MGRPTVVRSSTQFRKLDLIPCVVVGISSFLRRSESLSLAMYSAPRIGGKILFSPGSVWARAWWSSLLGSGGEGNPVCNPVLHPCGWDRPGGGVQVYLVPCGHPGLLAADAGESQECDARFCSPPGVGVSDLGECVAQEWIGQGLVTVNDSTLVYHLVISLFFPSWI